MATLRKLVLALLLVTPAAPAGAQTDESEELKIAALEALMSAPPERALPIVTKVLQGDGSIELKEHALFVLGQIDLPEAHRLLVETSRTGDRQMRLEAIRAIAIGGNEEAMAGLGEIYTAGDAGIRDAVLEAYLIADDADAVYRIAANTANPDEFEQAVATLGAMGALEQLRALRDRPGAGTALIEAYAIAGDVESLRALATDGSDPERQAQAVQGLSLAGGDEVGEILKGVYRSTDSTAVKEAVLEGLLMADADEIALELFRASEDPSEKRRLLEMLVMMDSESVWDVVDQTLEEEE